MLFKNKKLLFIFFLALTLRIVSLSSVPYGFHNDEVDAGYEGLFILKNGHDTYGHFLPIYFDKFGDFRPTGIFYLSGFSNLVLGPSVFATRLPGAIAGALTVFPVYFLVLELFYVSFSKKKGEGESFFERLVKKDKKFIEIAALASAFFLAILPWHIVLSRATQEAIFGLLLICASFWQFLSYFRRKSTKSLVIGALLLFFAYFFYTAHRILIPLILMAITFESFRLKLGSISKRILVVLLLFLIFTGFVLSTDWGRGRGEQVSILSSPTLSAKLDELAHFDGPANVTVSRIYHNKPVVYAREILEQYFVYFSGSFLFIEGGYPQRYSVSTQGLLLLSMLPLVLVGGALILVGPIVGLSLLPLLVLLISPLAAVFTNEDIPNLNRASLMIVPLVIMSGIAFAVIYSSIKGIFKNVLLLVFSILLAFEFSYFWHEYTVHGKLFKSWVRDGGVSEMIKVVSEKKNNYDSILVSYNPNRPLYYLFSQGIYDSNLRISLNNKEEDFVIGNVYFIRLNCPSNRVSEFRGKNVLIIDEANCVPPSEMEIIGKIRMMDGNEAFNELVFKSLSN